MEQNVVEGGKAVLWYCLLMTVMRIISTILNILLASGFWACSALSLEGRRGQITVHNNCTFPLYVEGIARGIYLRNTIKPKDQISHPFRLTINGTGNSLQIATHEGSRDIVQVEYSACFENTKGIDCYPPNLIFYDLSKINGRSQTEYGIRITPTCQHCVSIDCPAGVQKCDMVYYTPTDNYATKACDVHTDLNVELCPMWWFVLLILVHRVGNAQGSTWLDRCKIGFFISLI